MFKNIRFMSYGEIQREIIVATSSLINTVSVHVGEFISQPDNDLVVNEIDYLVEELLIIKQKIML